MDARNVRWRQRDDGSLSAKLAKIDDDGCVCEFWLLYATVLVNDAYEVEAVTGMPTDANPALTDTLSRE